MKLKYYNISRYFFYLLMIVTAVILLLFYFVGYDNVTMIASGQAIDPQFTDLLMYWMYALIGICLLCTIAAAIYKFYLGLKDNPKKTLKSLIGIALILVVLFISFLLADDTAVRTGEGLFEEKQALILSDVVIYTQYVLVIAALLCTIVSLTGVIRTSNKIKA